MKSKEEFSWHKFHSYVSECVSEFMMSSTAETFSHHLLGLFGSMAYFTITPGCEVK
jgi:hypothetical protein